MVGFDRSKKYSKGGSRGRGRSGGRRDSRGSSSRRSFGGSRDRRDSRGGSSRRSFGGRRDSGRRNRDNAQRTKVTCASCGNECEIPFKPMLDKPVYCDNCFSKESKGGSKRGSGNRNSGKDLKIINEKLDKIMKALKIE